MNLNQDDFFQLIALENATISIQYHAKTNGKMNIYNAQGQLISSSQPIQPGTNTLQIPNLSVGLYFVEIFNNDQHCTKKVIIQ
jgi:hypothetical protein